MYTHDISLSFDNLNTLSSDIKIKQNDIRAHKFIIEGIDFTDADRAVIKFLRPDGVSICDEFAYNNPGEYTVCSAALAESGNVKAEISLYSGDMRITSCTFVFEVVPDINTDFSLNENDTLPILHTLLCNVDNCVKKETGKGLSSNDFTDKALEAVENLGYSKHPTMNIPMYSSNSVFEINKLESRDTITGGLQVDTYLMLKSPGGWQDVVCGSVNLQQELDKKADKATTLEGYGITDAYTQEEVNGRLNEKVSFTDYPSDIKAGVIKLDSASIVPGLELTKDGELQIYPAENSAIDGRLSCGAPITPYNLDYAVRSVRPNVVKYSIPDTLEVNTIYSSPIEYKDLTLNLPSSAVLGDFIEVTFCSGETPSTLTVSSGIGLSDIDLIPEANTIYSLYFNYDLINISKTVTGGATSVEFEYGWQFAYAEYPYREV